MNSIVICLVGALSVISGLLAAHSNHNMNVTCVKLAVIISVAAFFVGACGVLSVSGLLDVAYRVYILAK